MKDIFNYICDFFKSGNINRFDSSKLLVFVILFTISNHFFNITKEIKTFIAPELYFQITDVSKIFLEFIFTSTIVITVLSLLLFVLYSVVDKFDSQGKISSRIFFSANNTFKTSISFTEWGMVLVGLMMNFEFDYLKEFFLSQNRFINFVLVIICFFSILDMLSDAFYYREPLTYSFDKKIKVENSKKPLKIEIVNNDNETEPIVTTDYNMILK